MHVCDRVVLDIFVVSRCSTFIYTVATRYSNIDLRLRSCWSRSIAMIIAMLIASHDPAWVVTRLANGSVSNIIMGKTVLTPPPFQPPPNFRVGLCSCLVMEKRYVLTCTLCRRAVLVFLLHYLHRLFIWCWFDGTPPPPREVT